MKQVTLIKCDDGAIWVTSDEDQNGTESTFSKITDESEQMMIALAEFLGYEPAIVLNLDLNNCVDKDFEAMITGVNNDDCESI